MTWFNAKRLLPHNRATAPPWRLVERAPDGGAAAPRIRRSSGVSTEGANAAIGGTGHGYTPIGYDARWARGPRCDPGTVMPAHTPAHMLLPAAPAAPHHAQAYTAC